MDTIKDAELFKVHPRWLFLKITTSEGIEGWGEPIVEGKADTVAKGDESSKLIDSIRQQQKAGFQHVKMNVVGKNNWIESPKSLNKVVEPIEEIRNQIGWDIGIGLAFHGQVHKTIAKVLVSMLVPLKPLFLGELLLQRNDLPGLGVNINKKKVRKAAQKGIIGITRRGVVKME